MSGVTSTNASIQANETNPLAKTSQGTGNDPKLEITPKVVDSRGIIRDLSRALNAKQALKDQLTKFTAFGLKL